MNRRKAGDNELNKRFRIALLILLSFIFIAATATAAEAAVGDKLKSTWASMAKFVLSGAFWINALIIFAVLFILYSLLLSQKIGSDTSAKVIMILLVAVIAIIIATKIVASNGAPEYLWRNTQFEKFTRFVIGPRDHLGACGNAVHDNWKAIVNWNPNPPCCGDGAYWTTVKGERVCRQAILRSNESGAGIPAFIVGLIIFFLLFKWAGPKLGFDSMGSGGSKWLPIILSVILAALVTNQRITKNGLVVVAGWITFIAVGISLSRKWQGEGRRNKYVGAFAFGLSFAAIELVANMLGTSLIGGGEFGASDIGLWQIIKNIMWGALIGLAYYLAVGNKVVERAMERVNREQYEEVEENVENGDYGRALGRDLPWPLGSHHRFRPRREDNRRQREEARINRRLEYLAQQFQALNRQDPNNRDPRTQMLLDRMYRDMQECFNALDQLRQGGQPAEPAVERPEQPEAPPPRGPPPMPE